MTSMLSRTPSRPEQAAWVLFGFLLASGQIAAHHGTRVSYDSTNPTRITGTVTEFVWRNPHARLFFDVTDEEGNVVNWGGEMTSPTTLARSGWTRTTLEPGGYADGRHLPLAGGHERWRGQPDRADVRQWCATTTD